MRKKVCVPNMHIAQTSIMRSRIHRVDSNDAIKMRYINENGRQPRKRKKRSKCHARLCVYR